MRDFEVPNLSVVVVGCVPAQMVNMSTVAVVYRAGRSAHGQLREILLRLDLTETHL